MTGEKPIRVLTVDDTVVYRKIVSDIIAELPGVELLGTAHNGKIAMAKVALLKPDLLTLDLEMPEMNGLEVLAALKKEAPEVGAIMLSTLTQKGGEMTMKALELGAFDFIPKPQGGTMEENKLTVKHALAPMIKAFSRQNQIRSILKGGSHPEEEDSKKKPVADPAEVARPKIGALPAHGRGKSKIVGIGISTGGPVALGKVMPQLPADLNVPVLVVQHMPAVFTKSLADSLNAKCAIEVREAVDGEPLLPNTALIAPGRTQMKVVVADDKSRIIKITDDPPENSCKPSVDYLFRSIAHLYLGRATGVIMTGMGSDGTLGLKLMKRNGATLIAQDEGTCTVYGMPKEAIESGIVDVIAPLDSIAQEICRTLK